MLGISYKAFNTCGAVCICVCGINYMEMSAEKDLLNRNLNLIEFTEWYFDFLGQLKKEEYGYLATVYAKYRSSFYDHQGVIVSDEDANYLKANASPSDHILIKAYDGFLISRCPSSRNDQSLMAACTEYLKLLFVKSAEIKNGLPLANAETILKWTLVSHPEYRSRFSGVVAPLLCSSDLLFCLAFLSRLATDDDLCSLLTSDMYKEIIGRAEVLSNLPENNIERAYRYISTFLPKPKSPQKPIKKLLCEIMLRFHSRMDDRFLFTELHNVRDYMDALNQYNDSDYQIIDEEIERLKKSASESVSPLTIAFPKNPQEEILRAKEKSERKLETRNSIGKLVFLLQQTSPLSYGQLQEAVENGKSILDAIGNTLYICADGTPINYKPLSQDELFSVKTREFIEMSIGLYEFAVFAPFKSSFVFDEQVRLYIFECVKNSALCPAGLAERFTNLIGKALIGKPDGAMYQIIPFMERGFREYFKSEGLNIYKRNGKHEYIGWGDIFSNKKVNPYRDKLLETIDESFYFTLHWLMTDKYGFQLRNKLAHFLDSDFDSLERSPVVFYSIVLLIELVFAIQRDDSGSQD